MPPLCLGYTPTAPYLEGPRFTAKTDRYALKWILNLEEATGKLARRRLRLMKYDFEIIHRAGVNHQAADTLSTLDTERKDASDVANDIPVMESPQIQMFDKQISRQHSGKDSKRHKGTGISNTRRVSNCT